MLSGEPGDAITQISSCGIRLREGNNSFIIFPQSEALQKPLFSHEELLRPLTRLCSFRRLLLSRLDGCVNADFSEHAWILCS